MLRYHARRPAIHHEDAEAAKLARLALIVNVGDAAFWTVLPLQIAELAGGDGPVGYYFALVAVVGIAATLLSSRTFERRSKIAIGVVALVVMCALLIGMSLADTLGVLAVFDVPRSVAFLLVTIVLGLLVRDHATAADLAVQEGRFYLYSNLGWLIGPVLAGYGAALVGLAAVFAGIAGVFLVALVYLLNLHLSDHPAVTPVADSHRSFVAMQPLIEFLASPRLRRVLVLSLGLELWWIVSSIYIPLAVIDLGYGPETVGWVVTGGIVPLVVLESWVGRKAQLAGTRPYLVAGFLILAVGAASFTVLGFSPELLLFMFAAVNVGAALVEPLADTRFFEVATGEEARRYFGIYNAAAPMASLVGPLLAAVAISLGLGLNGVWLMAAAVLIGCAWIALGVAEDARSA